MDTRAILQILADCIKCVLLMWQQFGGFGVNQLIERSLE